jgi:hypothetical protein
MKRKYKIEFNVTVNAEVEDGVIEQVTDDWRSMFYNLRGPKQILQMVIGCIAFKGWKGLTDLDGWANLSDDMVKIEPIVDCEIESMEVMPPVESEVDQDE